MNVILEAFGIGFVSRLIWEPARRYIFEDRRHPTMCYKNSDERIYLGPSRWEDFKHVFKPCHHTLEKPKLLDSLKDICETVLRWKSKPLCARCNRMRGLLLESSRTAYHFEGDWFDPKNPNKPVLLCRECAVEHHEYWTDMWREYYSSQLM